MHFWLLLSAGKCRSYIHNDHQEQLVSNSFMWQHLFTCITRPLWKQQYVIPTSRHLHAGLQISPDAVNLLSQGRHSQPLDKQLQDLLMPAASAELATHIKLLQACNAALDVVKVAGCETALYTLGRSCLSNSVLAPGSGSDQLPNEATGKMAGAQGQQTDTASQGQSEHAQGPAVSALRTRLLTDLANSVCHLPSAMSALEVGTGSASVNFPKFQRLVEILAKKKTEKAAWHGIVFVKTRQGVRALTAMLRKASELKNMSFLSLMGHAVGSTVSSVAAAFSLASTSSKGMKVKDQTAALTSFREGQGHQVLITTAVAEEGLDIPTCEFVVCYTVVESGREWIQRQGRARMQYSEFFNIIEQGSADQKQLEKAQQEAANAYAAALQSGSYR